MDLGIISLGLLMLVSVTGVTLDSDAGKAKVVALDNLNKSDKAIKAYDKAIEINPLDSTALKGKKRY